MHYLKKKYQKKYIIHASRRAITMLRKSIISITAILLLFITSNLCIRRALEFILNICSGAITGTGSK